MTEQGDPPYRAYIEAVFALQELHHTIRDAGGLTPKLYEQLVNAWLVVWKAHHKWHERKCRRAEQESQHVTRP